MIRCLVTGSLYSDPQTRTSQAGKPFTTAKLKADGKDGATVSLVVDDLAALKPKPRPKADPPAAMSQRPFAPLAERFDEYA